MFKSAVLFVAVLAVVGATSDLELNSEEFVAKINKDQSLWQAAPNDVTKKGFEYMKRLMGAKFVENNAESNLPVVDDIDENIPESFDSRTKWGKCQSIASIKDQGECGSCWAVSVAAAASDRLCIQSKFKTRVNISAENILSCCSTCVDTDGCSGGYPEKAWDYLMKTGVVTGGDYESKEGCQPYEIPPSPTHDANDEENEYTPSCHKKCTNKKYSRSFNKDKHYGKKSFLVKEDEAAIQTEIMKNGPVSAGFIVYFDFMFYRSGVYVKTSTMKMGGHAVRVIGWGVEKGVKYWLVANSWGRSWGEDGTFRIRRGTNECEFESYVTAGLLRK